MNNRTEPTRINPGPASKHGQWVFVPKGCAVLVIPIPPDDNPAIVRGEE